MLAEDRASVGQAFIDRSRAYLLGEYLPKIRRAVLELSTEDVWWRPNPASNSVGNLVLHLAGNARQWVVSGLGGRPDIRQRQEEFDREGGLTPAELLELLDSALQEVDGVLTELTPEDLDRELTIQGLEITGLEALYHVVEHFSMHAGQIIYVSKLQSGADLGFYRVTGGDVETMW